MFILIESNFHPFVICCYAPKYEFFVKVQDYNDRGIKGLQLKASESVGHISKAMTFELYVIKQDLTTNPIAENSEELRKQADVCSITFDTLENANNNTDDWINNVKDSIDGDCNFKVCRANDCESIRKTNDDEEPEGEIEGYRYCKCDVVVDLDDKKQVFLFTVEDTGNETVSILNDIKLLGLFDKISKPDGAREIDGLPPINTPKTPAEVPRFRTLQVFFSL